MEFIEDKYDVSGAASKSGGVLQVCDLAAAHRECSMHDRATSGEKASSAKEGSR